jgi:hypothetical protein
MFIGQLCLYTLVLCTATGDAASNSIVGLHSAASVIPLVGGARPVVPVASAAPAADNAKFGQTVEILGGVTLLKDLRLTLVDATDRSRF